MKYKNLFKLICKTSAIAFGFSALFFSSKFARANELAPCSGTGTTYGDFSNDDACMITPSDQMTMTIYEMGICTANPLVNTPKVMSYANCVQTLSSPAGTSVDLVASSQINLPPAAVRPANDTYTHAYIIIGKTFGLKGTYTISGETWYSKNDGEATKTQASYSAFNDNLNAFSDNFPAAADYGPQSMGTGSVQALLIQSDGSRATNTGNVDKVVGVFSANPGNEVIIDESALGLNVELKVVNAGYTVSFETREAGGAQPAGFSSGPFRPVFSVIK